MKLYELTNILRDSGEKELIIRKSPLDIVPQNFHITEIGNVKKDFVDCGGVRRQLEYCALQVWVANDFDHRLRANKLLAILEKGLEFIDENNIVNFEIQEETICLYELFGVTNFEDRICLEVAKKYTACLAPDKCGVKVASVNSCSGKGCC
jgi:hypothetical protein